MADRFTLSKHLPDRSSISIPTGKNHPTHRQGEAKPAQHMPGNSARKGDTIHRCVYVIQPEDGEDSNAGREYPTTGFETSSRAEPGVAYIRLREYVSHHHAQ